ncbi:hypothetical protein [Actinoplanes sp. NPDC049599]|uniref:hypothetical protein n=1 Tax=Actinoplanes sp. NPDC049599 TaxID=3363903 RepID=UPI0037B5FC16
MPAEVALTGAALTGAALTGVALTGVALTGVALSRVGLSRVGLTGVALSWVGLTAGWSADVDPARSAPVSAAGVDAGTDAVPGGVGLTVSPAGAHRAPGAGGGGSSYP